MAKPRGIAHLLNHLRDHFEDYAIIGGGAAAILMEENGLEFRATKDIDVVFLTHSSSSLNSKVSQYIKDGEYDITETSEGIARYYRFRNPKNNIFPEIIEIFARNEQNIDLEQGQYIIPIQNNALAKISAILLDDEYFNIIKSNCIQSKDGAPIINPLANICLKARAYRDLSVRKEKMDNIDSKDIAKHKKDILRLAVLLNGNERINLGPQTKIDMAIVLEELHNIDEKQFKVVMEKFPGIQKSELLRVLKTIFIEGSP